MSIKKKRILKIMIVTVSLLVLSGVSYASFVGYKVHQTLNDIQDTDFNNEDDISESEDEKQETNKQINNSIEEVTERVRHGNTVSILIAGVDSEHGRFVGRSDVLMVAVIDLDSQESTLLSIPRDTYVEMASTGEYDKINHAYAESVENSMKTVENFLDIPIDHYVAINFTGFETFIDHIGGIELDVERTIYHNLHPDRVYLYPGVQKVNGSNALEYVRFRADGEGDFGRNRRQQQVTKAVLDQTLNIRTVTQIPGILDIVGNNIRTSMDTNTMLSLVRNLSSLTGEKVETLRLTGDGEMIGGIYYVMVDEDEHEEVVERLHKRMDIEYVTLER
ncbi:LCP family protein [Evansella cellulosilytica]|uniref:Cell envelope-related transcriptional attenuator n=1 Tax=Evansella cellulosilytica (strain ATCC 21833 / DSM 2522 / FERM P-1141 / JCM 9156 / N-4) TaxID=649639 RepID=E6TSB0_EVAC2|nr:LCP family protein [Evansella cellulosilytica]ADU31879.1 cell envelope-related transcriptional attenuator [Evansella cellulosilytica DSM 2522]